MDIKVTSLSPLDGNMYYAHTSGPTGEWHKLADHLQAVAERARSFAEPFGAGEVTYWLGALHDIGKINPRFQEYLQALAMGKTPRKTPHSIWGTAHEARVRAQIVATLEAELESSQIMERHTRKSCKLLSQPGYARYLKV